jgi:hypothetical protein
MDLSKGFRRVFGAFRVPSAEHWQPAISAAPDGHSVMISRGPFPSFRRSQPRKSNIPKPVILIPAPTPPLQYAIFGMRPERSFRKAEKLKKRKNAQTNLGSD